MHGTDTAWRAHARNASCTTAYDLHMILLAHVGCV